MRNLLAGFLALGMLTLAARGQESSPKADTFESLKKDFETAQRKYIDGLRQTAMEAAQKAQKAAQDALKEAKTDEEKRALRQKGVPAMPMIDPMAGPAREYSARFLAFAKKNAKDPKAFESMALALQTSGGATGKAGTYELVIKSLQDQYAAKPEIKALVRRLGTPDDVAAGLLREVMAKNTDRKVQALACKTLMESRKSVVQIAKQIKDLDQVRRVLEERNGKEFVEKLVASSDKAALEAESLAKVFSERFADVMPDLSIGKPAPEVVSQNLAGKPTRLSDLKGKVVVLDIWATWCGPCKAMIPHEREMVERLKDKPFALISISADEEKKTLTNFLEKEKMPWMHWWNGSQGGILEDWDVRYFPTMYVLDAKGIIRYRDLRGEKLEEAVNQLLEEAAKQ